MGLQLGGSKTRRLGKGSLNYKSFWPFDLLFAAAAAVGIAADANQWDWVLRSGRVWLQVGERAALREKSSSGAARITYHQFSSTMRRIDPDRALPARIGPASLRASAEGFAAWPGRGCGCGDWGRGCDGLGMDHLVVW